MENQIVKIAYLVASVLFIFGIKMLGKTSTARNGNLVSSLGMLVAVVAVLFEKELVGKIGITVPEILATFLISSVAVYPSITGI